jgi:uncharacterized membrane protein YdjX (TVP38/TMEM64 family)
MGFALAVIGIVALLASHPEWMDPLRAGLERNLSFGAFLALMTVLPVVGVPVSAFLVLGGVRFGTGWSLLAMAITFPIHLLAVDWVTRSVLRPRLQRFLSRRGYRLPEIPPHRRVLYTSIFTAVPSLPYAIKNYLLVLGGISRRLCFGLVLPIHLAAGVPFVVLGESVISLNAALALVLVALILLGQIAVGRLGKRVEGTGAGRGSEGKEESP